MTKLLFQNFRLVTPDNLRKLSDVYQQQFSLCGEMCYGEVFDTPEEIFDETYEGNCELWDVVAENNPEKVLYDVWIFDVDTACVFYTNTVVDTGVGMIQNYFDPIEIDTEETRQLSKDLQEAFDSKVEPDYQDEGSPAGAYKKAVDEAKKNQKEDED